RARRRRRDHDVRALDRGLGGRGHRDRDADAPLHLARVGRGPRRRAAEDGDRLRPAHERQASTWNRAWLPAPMTAAFPTRRRARRSAARAPAAPVRRSVRYPLSKRTAARKPVVASKTRTRPLPTGTPFSALP